MSLLSVSSIQNPAAGQPNILLNADGSVTLPVVSGTAPAQTQAGTLWFDIAGPTLNIRNAANTAWLPVGGGGGGTVTGVTATAPLASSGGTAPVISATLATATQAAAGTSATVLMTPQFAVPKDAATMTGAAILPSGTSVQQPTTLVAGMTRFNTTTADLEFYTGSAWNGATAKVLGAGATYDEGASILPSGTTAQRPAAPVSGMARVNTDTLPQLEQYAGGSWQPIGVITSNLTLNVATTGNDATGLGTVAAPWATPHRAMEYLSQYAIKQGVTVTVAVADGTYTFTTPLNLNHPNGSQIFINGGTTTGARPTTTLTGGNAVGNTPATLAANDTLLNAYYNTKWQFNGCTGLTCTEGGGVTVNTVLIRGNAVAGFSGVVTGNANPPTNSVFYASAGGINLGANVAVHNFGSVGVITLNNGSISAPQVTVTNCALNGIHTNYGGSIFANGAVTNNNGDSGTLCYFGGTIFAQGVVSRYNGENGISTNWGGSIDASASAICTNNGNNGVLTFYGGEINAPGVTASSNTFNGIITQYGGSINAQGATVSNNGQNGILTLYGGSITAPSATATNNGQNGITTNFGGHINAQGATVSSNSNFGVLASGGAGSINFVSGNSNNNGQAGVAASGGGSFVGAQNATVLSNQGGVLNVYALNMGNVTFAGGNAAGLLSPAANTVGNGNAIINA